MLAPKGKGECARGRGGERSCSTEKANETHFFVCLNKFSFALWNNAARAGWAAVVRALKIGK